MSGLSPEDEEQTGSGPEDQNLEQFEVDESLEETFPASDPPAWTLGRNHHEASEKPEAGKPGDKK